MNTTIGTRGLSGRPAGARDAPADGGTWRLRHRPEAAREARAITADVLRQWPVAKETADVVLLVVSELVTNAVEHARPPLALSLRRDAAEGGRVRVEVTDAGPADREGEWAASCAEGEHGRGLGIVDLVATAHGDRQETGRSIHWADLDVAA
jgi:anti-sigma regulatory factor (Ser/Thr protein kinase)